MYVLRTKRPKSGCYILYELTLTMPIPAIAESRVRLMDSEKLVNLWWILGILNASKWSGMDFEDLYYQFQLYWYPDIVIFAFMLDCIFQSRIDFQ